MDVIPVTQTRVVSSELGARPYHATRPYQPKAAWTIRENIRAKSREDICLFFLLFSSCLSLLYYTHLKGAHTRMSIKFTFCC
jgi:hypothetical protein